MWIRQVIIPGITDDEEDLKILNSWQKKAKTSKQYQQKACWISLSPPLQFQMPTRPSLAQYTGLWCRKGYIERGNRRNRQGKHMGYSSGNRRIQEKSSHRKHSLRCLSHPQEW